MRRCLGLLALLAVCGCGRLRGCGNSSSAPAAPARSTPSAAPLPRAQAAGTSSAEPDSPEARLAGRFLVIAHSSLVAAEGEPILEALRSKAPELDARQVLSTPFTQLRPCLAVVVAGAFATKEEALALTRRLKSTGVESYVKAAGPLAPDLEAREAACEAEAKARQEREARAAKRAEPRFVALGSVLLGHTGDMDKVALTTEDRRIWTAPLEADPTGLFKAGDAFDLYDEKGPGPAGCEVTGFTWAVWGQPHFGYFQQDPPAEKPGCGSMEALADVDCSGGPLSFALPAGTRPPVYYQEGEGLSEEEARSQKAALLASSSYLESRKAGEAHGEGQGLPLQEEVTLRAFSHGERTVVVALAHLWTGNGITECGGEDYEDYVSRIVLRVPGEEEVLLGTASFGAHFSLPGQLIKGVLDLEGDGSVEMLLHDPGPGSSVWLVDQHGSTLYEQHEAFCDCGC